MRIYIDEENKVLFSKPKEYMEKFGKGVLKQMSIGSWCVMRSIQISIPYNDEELLKLIKENPKNRKFFEIRFCYFNSTSYRWAKSREQAIKIMKERKSGEIDRVFIDEYTLAPPKKVHNSEDKSNG